MRAVEVAKCFVSGVLVWALVAACSDAPKTGEGPGASAGSATNSGGASGNMDTGGAPSMNGDAGSHNGTGAVAHAAGADGVGECECPVLPVVEPDVFFERECDTAAGNFQWAKLVVAGATADDLTVITARFFPKAGGTVAGWPADVSPAATAMAFKAGEAWAQCTGVARFRVPGSLAGAVE
jgi:hypothetical protein